MTADHLELVIAWLSPAWALRRRKAIAALAAAERPEQTSPRKRRAEKPRLRRWLDRGSLDPSERARAWR